MSTLHFSDILDSIKANIGDKSYVNPSFNNINTESTALGDC